MNCEVSIYQQSLLQVSRLILFPNLAYKSTFNSSISSRTVLNFPSIEDTDSSIFSVDEASISCTSGNANDMNVSPILYLQFVSKEMLSNGSCYVRDFVVFIC